MGLLNSDTRPRVVSTRFELFATLDIRVTTESGDALGIESPWEPQTFSTDVRPTLSWVLPRNGVMGRIINLACDTEDVAYISETNDCHRLFDFSAGERFQVEVSLSRVQICEDFPCEEPLPEPVALSSKPLMIDLRE